MHARERVQSAPAPAAERAAAGAVAADGRGLLPCPAGSAAAWEDLDAEPVRALLATPPFPLGDALREVAALLAAMRDGGSGGDESGVGALGQEGDPWVHKTDAWDGLALRSDRGRVDPLSVSFQALNLTTRAVPFAETPHARAAPVIAGWVRAVAVRGGAVSGGALRGVKLLHVKPGAVVDCHRDPTRVMAAASDYAAPPLGSGTAASGSNAGEDDAAAFHTPPPQPMVTLARLTVLIDNPTTFCANASRCRTLETGHLYVRGVSGRHSDADIVVCVAHADCIVSAF